MAFQFGLRFCCEQIVQSRDNHAVSLITYYFILKPLNNLWNFRKSTLILLLVTFAAFPVCNGEGLTIECLKKYLKDRNINEDILSYVNQYVGSLTDCESSVKSKLADIYSNLRNRLNSNRLHRPFVECAMRDIEEDDESYENLVLREAAVDMISNWRFWSYFSKSSRLEELRAAASRIVDKSLLKCKGHREFGDLFTNIQEGVVQWERSGEEEYCIRRYLIDNNHMNQIFAERAGFRDNPKNVRIDNLKCDPIVASVIERIYDELKESKKFSNCYVDVYRKNNYASLLLKAELLSKLPLLSKSDKSREKQDFINSIVKITYDTQDC